MATFVVAFWNSRGESPDLRKLKLMNEVIAGMPEAGLPTSAMKRARNELALEIAYEMFRSPSRRVLNATMWLVLFLLVYIGIAALLSWLLTHRASTPTADVWLCLGTAVEIVVLVIAQLQMRSIQRARTARRLRAISGEGENTER